jgi:transposase InsO family protein
MNNPHKNARLTPLGRAELVRRIIEERLRVADVAAGFGVSERTARKWLARWRSEGRTGLENRSSRPRNVANRLAETSIALIEHLRRNCRLTGEAIAAKLALARSTVAAWLTRRGLGRLASLTETVPARRYQRERPGELVHLDIKKLGRFGRTGHRITGERRGHRTAGAGWDFLHVAVDDATRLAYVEVLPDEKRMSTTGFLVRALRWFKERGIKVERVMTDNGSGYIAKLFRKALRMLRIRHIRTRPYTPKTNGKAERFIQTLMREWAYAVAFSSSDARAQDLPRWIAWYNGHRPHVSLGRRSPVQALAGIT